MKLKRMLLGVAILLLVIVTGTFVSVSLAQGATEFSDWDADDVERDAIAGYLDIYANVSLMPSSLLGKALGIQSVQYVTVHGALFMSPRYLLTELYGYDILSRHKLDIIASSDCMSVSYAQLHAQLFEGDSLSINAYDEYTETGYSGWSSRDTEPCYRYTEKELIKEGASSAILYNATAYLNSATYPADNVGIVADDDSEFNGVSYVADDGKSLTQYAGDIAVGYGGELEECLNGSLVLFGFNELEYACNVQLSFETDLGTSTQLGTNAFLIARKCFELFKRVRENVQDKAKTTVSLFKPLTGLVSGLVDIPQQATHYIKETIGEGLEQAKIGVRGIVGNAWAWIKSWVGKLIASVGGVFGILFIGGAITLTVFIIRRRKS